MKNNKSEIVWKTFNSKIENTLPLNTIVIIRDGKGRSLSFWFDSTGSINSVENDELPMYDCYTLDEYVNYTLDD